MHPVLFSSTCLRPRSRWFSLPFCFRSQTMHCFSFLHHLYLSSKLSSLFFCVFPCSSLFCGRPEASSSSDELLRHSDDTTRPSVWRMSQGRIPVDSTMHHRHDTTMRHWCHCVRHTVRHTVNHTRGNAWGEHCVRKQMIQIKATKNKTELDGFTLERTRI